MIIDVFELPKMLGLVFILVAGIVNIPTFIEPRALLALFHPVAVDVLELLLNNELLPLPPNDEDEVLLPLKGVEAEEVVLWVAVFIPNKEDLYDDWDKEPENKLPPQSIEGVELEVFAPPNKVEGALLPLKGVDVGLVALKVVEPADLLNSEN